MKGLLIRLHPRGAWNKRSAGGDLDQRLAACERECLHYSGRHPGRAALAHGSEGGLATVTVAYEVPPPSSDDPMTIISS
jgi:hypothetical protein